MQKRAESLTDIVNLFRPKALTVEQSAFYQKTAAVRDGSDYEFHDGLYKQILASVSPARLLVVGHGGCGKTTELLMLKDKLSKNEFPVIVIDAKGDLDLYNFSYVDILMLIVEKLTGYAKDHELSVNQHLLNAFQKALSTTITEDYWNTDAKPVLPAKYL